MKASNDTVGHVRNTDEADDNSVRDDSDHDESSIQSEDHDGPSDDELEDEDPALRRLQYLISWIKKTRIERNNARDWFGKDGQYASDLTDRSDQNKDNILHLLVKEDATGEETKNMASGVKYIAKYHPKLAMALNNEKKTPLYCALENLDKKRAYLIKKGFLSGIKKDRMAEIIARKCGVDGENCLHRALRSGFLDFELLNGLIDSVNRDAVNARDNRRWTPLHRAVQYEHSSEEQLKVVQKLIEIGETDPDSSHEKSAFVTSYISEEMSVYQYHMKTREDEKQREKERAARSTAKFPKPRGIEDSKQWEETDKARLLGKTGPIELQLWADKNERTSPMPNYSEGVRHAERGQGDVPKLGVIRMNTNVKRSESNSKMTEKKDTREEKGQEREQWSQAIRNELKLHCLRTKSIAQATRFLYGTNKDDVQLYFDYSGLPKEDADPKTFYDNFQMTQFDEVLQYVEFPPVRLKDGRKPPGNYYSNHSALCSPSCNGRKDLLFFFSWLKDKGVKHIIRVIVHDSTDWHCDEVIEKCLSPFRIDILDWSKPDLDPEILCTAVPHVKEIHLRWGGNNAVLRSWSETEGLRLLKDLRMIYLHHDQSSEYSKRKLEGFIQRITTSVDYKSSSVAQGEGTIGIAHVSKCPSIGVQIKSAPDYSSGSPQTASVATSEATVANKPTVPVHKWLDSIDNFAVELKNLMHKLEKMYHTNDEVKVALIDDGVDLCEKPFRERIIRGKSLGYWDGEHRAKQWYVSETGHGTVMAHMIIRVCPMAKIYPIKLDTAKDQITGVSKIKPESAAAAIDAAVEKGVHIISMSWTIDKPQGEIKKRLDQALENACSKGILMFCSSPDEGNYGSGDPYPSAYAAEKFFRIGASQADGHAYSWVPFEKVDYIFPGVEVVQANKKDIKLRGVEDRKAGTGSSISTALAAGLAALVIWFVIIGARYSRDEHREDGAGLDSKDIEDIQDIKRMDEAFQKLGVSRESKTKFIEIWTVLDDRTKALKDLHGDDDIRAARQVIHKLARNLIAKT